MKKTNPLVSVIIPCYNAERFVEKAVRSIMEQTYHNLEIICCDDCSSDSTLAILKKLSAEDERIQIIKHSENKQLIYTLNELVEIAGGEYIARMDADDISLPERIEKQLDFMQKNPEIDFCGCNAWHINENDKVIGKSTLPESYDDIKFFLPFYSTFYHPTVFAKAAVLKENPYDKEFIHAEDYELWCRLIFEKNVVCKNISYCFFKYRLSKGSICSSFSEMQKLISAKVFDKYRLFFYYKSDVIKNICFLQDRPITSEEFYYLNNQRYILNKYSFKFIYKYYIKLFFLLKKYKQYKYIFIVCFTKLGFSLILVSIVNKIFGKKKY